MRVFVRDRIGSRLMTEFFKEGSPKLTADEIPVLWRVCTVGRCVVGLYKLINLLELITNAKVIDSKSSFALKSLDKVDVQRCKRLLAVLRSQQSVMNGALPLDSGELNFSFFFDNTSVNIKEWTVSFHDVSASIDSLIFLAILYSEVCREKCFDFGLSDLLIPVHKGDHYELVMRRYDASKKWYEDKTLLDGPDYLYDPAELTLSKLNLEDSIRRSKNAY